MPPLIDSFVVLLIILLIARFLKRNVPLLQKFFIPSSLIAGIVGLILGPQVLDIIHTEVTSYWVMFPEYLITIVFAGLFLGKFIPSLKEIWRTSGSMIAFGNTLAWGQYVVGIVLTILVLTPIFGTNPLAASLIEISFEGGHGTAAGLAPTFQELGWAQGTDIALGLATFSLIVSIVSGIIFINIFHRKQGTAINQETWEEQKRELIRSGYDLLSMAGKFNARPSAFTINILAFALAIGLGWIMLHGLIWIEDVSLKPFTDIRFFTYLPLFSFAMIGGLLVQLLLKSIHKQTLIQRRTAENFCNIALDLLIASAVSTISLSVLSHNFVVFILLALAGVAWIVGAFFYFAPRFFSQHWFENGITNYGQSMGMTATGLLLNRLVDPSDELKVKESFSYKQLIFEPFMGGGMVTAMAAIVIHEFGSMVALVIAWAVMSFWIVVGTILGQKRSQ